MLRELLLAGVGVTLTPDFVVADLVATDRLVEALPAHRPAAQGVFGVVAHSRHVSQKVEAFLDFVGSQSARDRSLVDRATTALSRNRTT